MLEKECTFLDFKLDKEEQEHKIFISTEGGKIQL